MNRQIILVKHSVPEIREHLPAREWTLSEEGRRRSERLAGKLIQFQPEVIISSPEPKARETAEILAENLELPMRVNDALHEHERGLVPFLTRPEFEAAVREFFENPSTLVFGSETADQAHERFSGAVHSLISDSDKSKIVLVSHGTVISLFVSRLTGLPGYQVWSDLGLPGFIVLDLQSKELIALENIA